MIFHSIRWRVQTWHGLLLVLVLAGFGFTAYHVARDNQMRRVDLDLEQQLASLFRPQPPNRPPERPPDLDSERNQERPPGFPPERRWNNPRRDPAEFFHRLRDAIQQADSLGASPTNTFYSVLWQQDGTVAARSAGSPGDVPRPERVGPPALQLPQRPEPPPDGGPPPPGRPMFASRTRGEFRELYQFLPRGECLLVGRSLAPDLAAMHRLAVWLFAAGAGVLALGLAGGWWLATRAIRPIEEISATANKIAGGDLSQRINAADSDSELGRLAAVLNSTFARLEAAFAHQARFTADASHELRTPVSVILSQTQTALSRERPAAEYREALEACQRAAQRMRSLSQSLLELARLDAGQEPMKRERFDLARVARDCVELVRPLAAERGIEIRCELPATECLGDAERMGQVATNLLTNAIHFNREQGEVRIATQAENGSARLVVADTGQGIPDEDVPHIFERFYQVDKSRARQRAGTGLGLAICKAIVDAQGGVIELSSRPGVGSTFTVSLPVN